MLRFVTAAREVCKLGPVPLPTTLWTEIRLAGAGSRESLNRLAGAYWTPVYAYLRASGRDRELARDLTQGFFLQLLENDFFARARPEHGKFRSFLFAALRNFLSDAHDRETAAKRGGGRAVLSIDVDGVERALGVESDPARAFEREWALRVLQRAYERLKLEGAIHEAFRECERGAPHRDVAAKLGVSEQEVANRLHRARARLRELITEELRDTLDDPSRVDEEISDLFQAIS